ncbi:MAG: 1-acyl-sn-glycerol-3-phosphate acyltransferase [Desulfarculaceae bacterium]|nr:1-acyl-sn-glycerol-3-phosphate acyltransferase [Desulfarculaceae bacterium]
MKTIHRILYQPYKWLVAIPVAGIATLVLGVSCILSAFVFGQNSAHAIAVLWSRICCYIIPVRIRITGKEHYRRDRPYIIVANHQSMVDIPVLHGRLGLKIKWIIKKELEHIPVFGYACKKLGCIYIDRHDSSAAIQSIHEAGRKLQKGASVIFFPEGTRTRNGRLHPFKKGAFRFAKDSGIPVLPITIENTIRILPPETLDLFPGTVRVRIHPPVDLTDTPVNDLDSAISRIRNTISSAL